MAESKYEKYITRNAELVMGPGPEGGIVRYRTPDTFKITDKSINTTGPRMIFNCDRIPEAPLKVEYGWILRDMTLLNDDKNYGAHKHDYPEIFTFYGNDPYDTAYLGGEGEFWLGEGDETEKITFDTACSILVPGGVGHFPLYFKNVKSPIMMGVIMFDVDLQTNTPIERP
ncbi:MAG: hypothetical protein JW712_10670 [Dehalococcoidales bacterium]|nr:hypothetical protein [Dehalococcoidales bacterium]